MVGVVLGITLSYWGAQKLRHRPGADPQRGSNDLVGDATLLQRLSVEPTLLLLLPTFFSRTPPAVPVLPPQIPTTSLQWDVESLWQQRAEHIWELGGLPTGGEW